MKTRVAVIGLGKMGLMHASIISMLDNAELVAICEKNSFIRRLSKKVIPDVEIVIDLEDLCKMKLDAVCVTTPPDSHFQIIKAVYEREIARNIFTEKPLAVSYRQAEELCSLAEKHGGVNMVGYHRRFSVTSVKARELLEDDSIGKPISFQGYAYSADFLGAKSPSQAMGRGGVLEDLGCHAIDLALWLLGEMEVVSARFQSLIGDGSLDEVYLEVKTPDDLKGEFRASWCKESYRLPDIGLTITGTHGTLRVNEDVVSLDTPDGKSSIWYKHDLNDFVPFFLGGAEYQRQDELFIKSIGNGTEASPSFRTASRVERLVDQANSLAGGHRV